MTDQEYMSEREDIAGSYQYEPDPEVLAVTQLSNAINMLGQAIAVFTATSQSDKYFWEECYKELLSAGRTPDEAEHMASEAVHHRAVAWAE